MILLVSNTEDDTCGYVERELRKRRLRFFRLNTDQFPQIIRGEFRLNATQSRLALRRADADGPVEVDGSDIRSVLYRRPVPPIPDQAIRDPGIRKFASDESYEFLRGWWLSLSCHWVSHPEAIRSAEHKIVQLGEAKELGFQVPDTLVTTDPDRVRDFFHDCGGQIVGKPLYLGFAETTAGARFVYTTAIRESDFHLLSEAALAPAIYQAFIKKSFDVRVTVVGDRVFAARIDADSLPAHIPDWRFESHRGLKHSVWSLPASVEGQCIDLVRRLRLRFGAIDLGVTPEGTYYFFEINPNGQWAWLEELLDLPIGGAIADELTR